MKEKITTYLKQLELDYNVEILLACETGSRAWGFPSPDSDFDVRFIYKHHKDWYLSLNPKKDSIELMFENNEFDLSGWDLRKSLNLLWKSNPPLLERIQSPIIYKSNPKFLLGINELSKSTYSKIATMHHYLSMSIKMFSEIKDNKNIKLKKLFYALRTATACKWIIERNEIPPIVFPIMLEHLKIDNQIKYRIYELIELKSSKKENYLHHHESEIFKFIENCIYQAEQIASSLPSSKGQMEELNTFFIQQLQ